MAGIVMPLAAYAVVSRLRLLTLTGLGRDRPRVPPLSSATPAVS